MKKNLNVICSLEQFTEKGTGKEIVYVKLTADVLGISIRLRPNDATTAELLKAYLTTK